MRKKETILILLFICSGIFYYLWSSSFSQTNEDVVIRIIDGDTIELQNFGKVRLLGINTPEKNMLNYELGLNYLEKTILNKTIQLDSSNTDKYGRKLGYIFFDDVNINEELVSKGYAHTYYYDKDKYYNSLMKAEEKARTQNLGIWKKSPYYDCFNLLELLYDDNIYGEESLTLENNCNKSLNIVIKDDATHIYKRKIDIGTYTEKFSHIFNNDGDSLYVWDDYGLLIFYRYP